MAELNEKQKQKIKEWVKAGLSLSDIQKKIREEFNISMTFLDLRFLVLDMGLEVQDKKQGTTVDLNKATSSQGNGQQSVMDNNEDALTSGVKVELDRVVKAGALVSGTVTFSDGVSGSWSLDQFGRLALAASQPGYRPSQQDLEEFQMELARLLEKRGF